MATLNQVTHPMRRWTSDAGGTLKQYWYNFRMPVGHSVKDVVLALDVAQRDPSAVIAVKLYHGPAYGDYLSTAFKTLTPGVGTGLFTDYTAVSPATGPLYAWLAVVVEVSHATQQAGFLGSVAVGGKGF